VRTFRKITCSNQITLQFQIIIFDILMQYSAFSFKMSVLIASDFCFIAFCSKMKYLTAKSCEHKCFKNIAFADASQEILR